MTRTQKAAVKEFLERTGLDVTFRAKPPTAQEFTVRNRAEFGDSTKWTSADFETIQNLALRRPTALQRYGRWLRTHTLGAYLRWEQTAVQDPAAGLYLLGIALPVGLLIFFLTGLALTSV
ncbi:hypothetical protein ACIOEZ_32565 [Streptomyces sp. NPDC087866]|uniref:hypothetical protein n=1 Tax=Streptomyces sp. NPDC087866 TaxID=3365815 RepID=UPI003827F1CF